MSRPTRCPHCGVNYRDDQPWTWILTTTYNTYHSTSCGVCGAVTEHAERQPLAWEEYAPRPTITRLAAGAAIVACLLVAGIVWS